MPIPFSPLNPAFLTVHFWHPSIALISFTSPSCIVVSFAFAIEITAIHNCERPTSQQASRRPALNLAFHSSSSMGAKASYVPVIDITKYKYIKELHATYKYQNIRYNTDWRTVQDQHNTHRFLCFVLLFGRCVLPLLTHTPGCSST